MPSGPGALRPGSPLTRAFLSRRAVEVAPDLLGCLLVHRQVVLRLTEVEAYEGGADPGSHAFRGPTPRTEVMFGPAGHLYVYRSYGIHWAVNVVTGAPGAAAAVLLRAGEVVQGADLARPRREEGRATPVPDRDLARGPGRLTVALGIGAEHRGLDLCTGTPGVQLLAGETVPATAVRRGPRVGVSGKGGDGGRFPWRFWLADEPTVSVYRPAARRLRRADPPPRAGRTPR